MGSVVSTKTRALGSKKNRRGPIAVAVAASLAAIYSGTSGTARAASGVWTGAADTTWANANWSASPVPGLGDTATFSSAGNGNTAISLGSGVTIASIVYDTSSAAAYTLGTGAVGSQTLTLDNGGAITVNNGVINTQLINAAIVLGDDGSAQNFSLTNNSATNPLTVAGSITGSTGSGVKNVSVSGAGAVTVSGIIGDGSGGTVSLVKSGANTMTLSGVNTFTGGITLTSGTTNVTNILNLGAAPGTVTLNGGTLNSMNGLTNAHPINVGSAGGTINVGGFNVQQFYLHSANALTGSGTLTITNSSGHLGNDVRVDTAQTGYTGNIILQNGGVFEYGVANAVGPTATFTVNSGGELAVNNAVTSPNAIAINGGVLSFENGNTGSFSGSPITIGSGGATIGLRDYYTLNTARGGTIAGTLGGVGGITVTSGSASGATLTLTASNSYTGATIVNNSNLTVSGASGVISSSSGYTFNNGKVTLDYTTAVTDKLNNAGVVTLLSGAELSLTNNATFATSESIAGLSLGTGNSIVTLNGNAGGILDSLIVGSTGLSRSNNATALIRGSNLGATATNSTQLTIDGTNGTGLTFVGADTSSAGAGGGIDKSLRIIPYLLGDTSASGNGKGFLTYDTNPTTGGLRLLDLTNEYNVLSGAYTTPATAENVQAFNGSLITASDVTVNSLLFNTATQTLTGSGGALVVSSGALAATTSADTIGTGFSRVTLGNGEGVVTATSGNTFTINTPISVTGAGILTKAGAGTLVLGATNTYTGTTIVNQGVLAATAGVNNVFNGASGTALQVNNGATFTTNASSQRINALTLTGNAVVAGATGTLDTGGDLTYDASTNPGPGATISTTTLNLNGTRTFTVGKAPVDFNPGNYITSIKELTVSSALVNGSGTGSLVKAGPGVLQLSGTAANNTFTGPTIVNAGTLYFLDAASGLTGGVPNSDITVNPGAALAAQSYIQNNVASIGKSLTLNSGTATFGTADNPNSAVGRQQRYVFSGSLTLNSGNSVVSINNTQNGGFGSNIEFSAISRNPGATVLFRGQGLGAGALLNNSAHDGIIFTTAPTLVGGGGAIGTVTTSIILYAIGDNGDYQGTFYLTSGLGTDFVTYGKDATSAELLTTYSSTIGSGSVTTNNTKITDTTLGGINASSTINSLILNSSGATVGQPGQSGVDGTGTLTLTSGALLVTTTSAANANGGSNGNFGGLYSNNATIGASGLTLNFGSTEGIITTAGPSTLTLAGPVTGTSGLSKSGAGTLNLNSANTLSGTAYFNGGTVVLNNSLALQNAVVNYNNAGGNLSFGSLSSATFGGMTGSQNLALANVFSSPVALTVGNSDVSSVYSGGFTGGGSLVKTGAGTFTLAGSNNYSGTTSVNNGMLKVNGRLTNSAVTVNPGGVLGGTGTISSSVSLTTGTSAINLQDGSIGTLTLAGGLSLTNGNQLSYDVGSSADRLSLGGGFSSTGTTSINLTNLTGFTAGTYTLISGTGLSNTSAAASAGPFSLSSTSLGGFSLKLQLTSGNLQLLASQAAPNTAYWYGSHDGNWGTVAGGTNWVSGPHVTTDTGALPADISDVHFVADSATHLTTTLDQAFTINSLTFDNGASTVSIGGSQNLTVNNGITQASGAGPATINTTGQLLLGLDQSFTNNSASKLTVTSSIGGAHALTTAGTGVIQLGGSNTYANGTTISAGTLQVANANALSTGTVTVNANLDLNGTALNVGTLAGSSAGVVTNSSASAASLYTNFSGGTSTYAGAIRNGNGSVSLTKDGAGALVLTGSNTFSGGTTIAAGTLQLGNGITDGSIDATSGITDNGALVFNPASNRSAAYPISGTGSVVKIGSATTVALTGANSYSGSTTITAGTLEFDAASAMSSNSALTIGSASTLGLRADADTTFQPASFLVSSNSTLGIAVNSLNSPAGDGHTLTLTGQTVASSNNDVTLNISSTTSDTLKINTSAVYGLAGNSGSAWGGNNNIFNLTGANVILNGLNQASNGDVGLTLNSSTANSLAINGTVTTNTNRTVFAVVNSGVLNLNNTVTDNGGANNGFFVTLIGGVLNVNNANAIATNAGGGNGGGAGLKISGGTLNNTSGSPVTLSTNPTIRFDGDFNFGTATSTSANNLSLGTGAASLGVNASAVRTFTVNGAAALTIGGAIANGSNGTTPTTAIDKAGTGTLVLAGANSFSGSTSIDGGVLDVTGAISSGTVNINAGSLASALILDGANAVPSSAIVTATSSGSLSPMFTANAGQTFAALTSSGTSTFNASSTVNDIAGTGTLVVTAPTTLTVANTLNHGAILSDGTINLNAGSANIVGTIDGAGTLALANGANLSATYIRQGALSVGPASTVTIAYDAQAHTHGTPIGTSVVTTLSIDPSTGTLDLTNNGIVILDTTQLSTVRALITQAADVTAGVPHWDMPGITSSTAAGDPSHAIGYALASALPNGGSTSFNGITFSDAVIARYTLVGDTGLKGTVDLSDYTKVVLNLGKSNASWSDGNFDYSGNVNLGDYTAVIRNLGRSDGESTVFNATGPSAAQVKASALTLHTAAAVTQATTATDVTLLVNPTNGRVTLVNALQTGQAVITAYTINSPSQSLLPFSADGGGKYLANALENNPSVFYKASNGLTYNLWTGIKNVSTFIGEGFSNHYNANVDSTWTNYTLATSGYALGTLFKRLSSGGTRDLVFQWEDANLNTYTSVVTYVGAVPEPGSVSLIAAGAMAMLGRRRRRSVK